MNIPKKSTSARSFLAICAIAMVMGAGAAFPEDAPAPVHAAPTKEMREKMATLHDQMGVCLRSDKAIATCNEEMMQACRDTMGEKGCPMMIGVRDPMGKEHPMGTMSPK